MKLIIVRHGETIENQKNIAQGQLPGHLSDEGKFQAEQVGRELLDKKIDLIISSDLERARDTTTIIKQFFPKTPARLSKKLRERDFGDFQGKPYPENWNEVVWAGGIIKEHGGENNPKFISRIKGFLTNISQKHAGKTIVLVTHKRVIQTILAIKNKTDVDKMKDLDIPENGRMVEVIL